VFSRKLPGPLFEQHKGYKNKHTKNEFKLTQFGGKLVFIFRKISYVGLVIYYSKVKPLGGGTSSFLVTRCYRCNFL
jgi:hypothetical protein